MQVIDQLSDQTMQGIVLAMERRFSEGFDEGELCQVEYEGENGDYILMNVEFDAIFREHSRPNEYRDIELVLASADIKSMVFYHYDDEMLLSPEVEWKITTEFYSEMRKYKRLS